MEVVFFRFVRYWVDPDPGEDTTEWLTMSSNGLEDPDAEIIMIEHKIDCFDILTYNGKRYETPYIFGTDPIYRCAITPLLD